jgi:hypothetical protein
MYRKLLRQELALNLSVGPNRKAARTVLWGSCRPAPAQGATRCVSDT